MRFFQGSGGFRGVPVGSGRFRAVPGVPGRFRHLHTPGQGQSTPGETAGITKVVTVDQKIIIVKENLYNVIKCFSNKAL